MSLNEPILTSQQHRQIMFSGMLAPNAVARSSPQMSISELRACLNHCGGERVLAR